MPNAISPMFEQRILALALAYQGTEVIYKRGPWRSLEQVELATAEWADWWSNRRLHGAADYLPPAEYEELYRLQLEATDVA